MSIHIPDFPPEVESGNIEYKIFVKATRLTHLEAQMNSRIFAGEGAAIYRIGVLDNGKVVGVIQSTLEESIRNLRVVADRLGATLTVTSKTYVGNEPEVLHTDHQEFLCKIFGDGGNQTRYIAELCINAAIQLPYNI